VFTDGTVGKIYASSVALAQGCQSRTATQRMSCRPGIRKMNGRSQIDSGQQIRTPGPKFRRSERVSPNCSRRARKGCRITRGVHVVSASWGRARGAYYSVVRDRWYRPRRLRRLSCWVRWLRQHRQECLRHRTPAEPRPLVTSTSAGIPIPPGTQGGWVRICDLRGLAVAG